MFELFSLEVAAAIEARQDELLTQLDALNRRIEQAIAEFALDRGGGLRAAEIRFHSVTDADPSAPTC